MPGHAVDALRLSAEAATLIAQALDEVDVARRAELLVRAQELAEAAAQAMPAKTKTGRAGRSR